MSEHDLNYATNSTWKDTSRGTARLGNASASQDNFTKMPKILQLNCNRSREAHSMLIKIARQRRADILILSEPNKKMCGDGVFHTVSARDTAISFHRST